MIVPNQRDAKQILVIDDNLDMTLFLKIALETNGFFVKTYNEPLQALAEFKPHYYDLVLIDVRMPKLNGFELFNLLRKEDPNIRVCFMTAFEAYYTALIEEHPTVKARCFIKKPIEVNALLLLIRNQLDLPNKKSP